MNRKLGLMLLPLLLVACGRSGDVSHEQAGGHGHADEHAAEAEEFERGPHRGRLLRDGEFAVEVTIFESGVPPQFRLYAYRNDKPIDPAQVTASVTLKRLDGEENRFDFRAENGYLTASATVEEPHSFDVRVEAAHAGSAHHWEYESHEGRTTIAAAVASEAGVKVETAGPVLIRDTVDLVGAVVLDANRHVQVKARYPGVVRSVQVEQGQRVRRGQVLAGIEGNESMRVYTVTAPLDGTVLSRHANEGDVASDEALFELADLSRVWVEVRAIGSDAERLAPGQAALVRSATGGSSAEGRIGSLLPVAGSGQSVVARITLPNSDGRWRPGMTVSARVALATREVPLAVKESALQRFRDFTVVFARVGETYEVRMLETGASDGEYVEVLGGLKPGTAYVTEQSYLIKADIEKSGASHDH